MMYPGLASWAKFGRPCGTELGPKRQGRDSVLHRYLSGAPGMKGKASLEHHQLVCSRLQNKFRAARNEND
jgi:hypothetical protein